MSTHGHGPAQRAPAAAPVLPSPRAESFPPVAQAVLQAPRIPRPGGGSAPPGDESAPAAAPGRQELVHDQSRLRRRVRRDAAAVALVMVGLALLVVQGSWFDRLVAWNTEHPGARAGELMLLVALAHGVMMVFGARRGRDLRQADAVRQVKTLELEHLARHDYLTGLVNRAGFADAVVEALETSRRTGHRLAILLLDLDRFKEVNDTLGHEVGDGLLNQVAARLAQRLGRDGVVARLGGDEFAVLVPDVRDRADALAVGHRLVTALSETFTVGELAIEVGASIGVACWPEDGDTPSILLRRADVAMYSAKAGHTGVEGYAPHLDPHTPERLAMFGELRRAVDGGELLVHYQPKASLRDSRVTGVEALVRWAHPTRGQLPPSEFLPVAETTGLIRPLTSFVLRTALEDVRRWRDAGRHLTVAVNLSAHSLLDADLPDVVATLLHDLDLPAGVLELEVTESHAMADPGRAQSVLDRLHALGVGLAIDDYGTGYSALSYLSRLPVQVLKIDQSFVQAMLGDAHARTIVRSTIDLARNLGLTVVAEGVETVGAWQELARYGCDSAQGFWLAHPTVAGNILTIVDDLDARLVDELPAQAITSAE